MVNGYKSVLDGKNNFQCYLDFFTFIFNWGDMYTSNICEGQRIICVLFYYASSRSQTQVVRFGSKHL